ncbi:sensor histidine kinase [Pseudokordiimonas caeni]|uniref:sensor histidine kinase n=1 Tax=Pseudokordiimonas caeni TaxID=2997908 RepID=UPI002812504F|nr:HAMP domain-containing sensor histidine kinase [Pseudokordiimonas caeni]
MSLRSLRLRLLAFAAIAIAGALALAALGLAALYDRHVERRIHEELATYLSQVSGGIEFAEDGSFSLGVPLADPRFEIPLSGLYWQIEDDEMGLSQHSRSLWDTRIALQPDQLDAGTVHRHSLPGPGGATLIVHERRIVLPTLTGDRSLRIAIALDHADLTTARNAFAADLTPSLALLGFVLFAAVWLQVSMGLRPLAALRKGIAAIRTGESERLSSDQPDEVLPLVEEVNTLLDAQEETVRRAKARAGDLAHGLKTPLTILQGDADRLRKQGEVAIAGEIDQVIDTMRRHVDRELARTRLAGAGVRTSTPCDVRTMVDRLVRTLERSPEGSMRRWEIRVPDRLTVRMEPDDLAELLGNLLDNAVKWATRSVSVEGSRHDASGPVVVTIRDDGPGVPEDALLKLGERGLRLDETAPGNGLGLAIARDILAAYGGTMTLTNIPEGGLEARLELPASPLPSRTED